MKTTKSKETVTQPSLEAYELSPEIRAAIAASEEALGRRKAFDQALDRNFEAESQAVLEYEAAKKAQADCEAELAICITPEEALKKEQAAIEAKKVAEEKRDAAERFIRLKTAIENRARETDAEIADVQAALKIEIDRFISTLMEPLAKELNEAVKPLVQAFMLAQAIGRATRGFFPSYMLQEVDVPNPTNHLKPLLANGFAEIDGTRRRLDTGWIDDHAAGAVFERLRVISDTVRKLEAHPKFVPQTAKQRQDVALARNTPATPAAPEIEWQPPKSTWHPTNRNISQGAASRVEPQEINMGAVFTGDIK
jgi:hypothetical protein